MSIPLSDLENACANWGAWAGSELVKLGYPPPALFRYYIPKGDARDPGWGDEEASPGPPTITINIQQAELLDPLLLKLRSAYWHRIRRRYLWHANVETLKLHEALRALGDLIEAKRGLRERLL